MRTYVHILRIHNLCHPRTNPPFCHNLWATNICITIFMHIIQFLIYIYISEYSDIYIYIWIFIIIYIHTHLCIYHGYMTRIMGIRIKNQNIASNEHNFKIIIDIYPSYIINIVIHGYYIRYILASTHISVYTHIYIYYMAWTDRLNSLLQCRNDLRYYGHEEKHILSYI